MPSYFECLHCGLVTPVEASPPKCGTCGHGTGVIHLQKPQSPEVEAGKDGQPKPTDSSNDPAGTSGMLSALEGLATA